MEQILWSSRKRQIMKCNINVEDNGNKFMKSSTTTAGGYHTREQGGME
jgi:hypothetical protein